MNVQAWLVTLMSLLLFLWYANPQLVYTLIFPYELLEFVFPNIAEMLRAILLG